MCLTRAHCVNPLITTIHTSTAVTAAAAGAREMGRAGRSTRGS